MTDYYINTASTGSGDGTTTAISGANAAWKNISEITGLVADDNVYFNKGNTWTELLTVPASGSIGSPITFGAYGSGDKPVIDGGNTRAFCITGNNKDYITIDGLELKDVTNTNIYFHSTSSYIVIQNCDIYHPYGRGINIYNCSYCTIEDNLIDTTAVDNGFQADGIYMELGGNHTIRGNTIYSKKEGFYVDCIQINQVGGTNTIEYNWLENPDGYASDTGNLVLNIEGSGTFNVRYNVLLNNNTNTQGCLLLTATGTYNVYNNVMVNLCDDIATVYMNNTATGFTLKNNIIYSTNDVCIQADSGISSPSNFDYNCYYRTSGTAIIYDGSSKTWAQWQTAGGEPNGINTDPSFTNLSTQDFNLQSDSLCIDAGDDLSLTEDYDGKPVPYNLVPDIGAYEYTETALEINVELKRR